MAEKKLKGSIAEPFDFVGIQVYCYAIADRLSAGGNRSISAFDFHKAEATGSKRCIIFSYGTQIGYIKPVIQGYPEDTGPFFSLDFDTVNG